MDNNLPNNNVLLAIAFALLTSIICTWVIATHFQAHNQVQFERMYDRISAVENVTKED